MSRQQDAFVKQVQDALLQDLLQYAVTTIDGVRAIVGVPYGVSYCVIGPAVKALQRAGLIEKVGSVQSSRSVARKRKVSLWAVQDRRKARAVLQGAPLERVGKR